jgi:peptide/nickel transport system ATP-binding protein
MNKIRARRSPSFKADDLAQSGLHGGRPDRQVIALHQKLNRKRAMDGAAEMLRLVNIPNAQRRVHDYRTSSPAACASAAMIAMAPSCQPKLLIADEPRRRSTSPSRRRSWS